MLTTAHIQRIQDWHGGFLADVGTSWIKAVNPPQGIPFPHMTNFDCRFWTDDIDAFFIRRGRDGGRQFVQMMVPRWKLTRATFYELANEPDSNSNDGLANLREYSIGAMEEADAHGVKVGILNLPEGNPHDNGTHDVRVTEWKLDQLRPAVVYAAQHGHFLTLHAYWRPDVEGPDGRWHALGRIEWTLKHLNVPNLRVVVSETGIDGGIAGHPGQQGWKRLSSAEQYRSQIVDAERFARERLRPLGVEALMYFTFGHEHPWSEFEHDEDFCRSLVPVLRDVYKPDVPPPIEEPVEDKRLIIELLRPLAVTPQTSRVTQWFGEGRGRYDAYGLYAHNGIDYSAPVGSPVRAMHPGTVTNKDQGNMGLGKFIELEAATGRYMSRYGHLSKHLLPNGARVKRGEIIGLSGNTGNSTAPHLHVDFMVHYMRNPGYGDRIDFAPFRTVVG